MLHLSPQLAALSQPLDRQWRIVTVWALPGCIISCPQPIPIINVHADGTGGSAPQQPRSSGGTGVHPRGGPPAPAGVPGPALRDLPAAAACWRGDPRRAQSQRVPAGPAEGGQRGGLGAAGRGCSCGHRRGRLRLGACLPCWHGPCPAAEKWGLPTDAHTEAISTRLQL